MDAHLIGFVPDGPELLDRLDVARQRIDQLTEQLAAVTAERDAYGDTLTGIRDHHDDDIAVVGVSAQVIARMVLEQRGYLPFGRLRQAEAALADARDEIAQLRQQLVDGYAEVSAQAPGLAWEPGN